MNKNSDMKIFSVFLGKSLAKKLAVVIASAVTLISLSSLAVHWVMLSKTNQRQFDQKSRQLIDYLTKSLELPLWNYDEEGVIKIGGLMKNSGIVSALTIQSSSGDVFFSDGEKQAPHSEAARVEIAYRNRKVGSFEIRMSNALYQKQQQELVIIGLFTIVLLISGILFSVVLSIQWFVKKPLLNFSKGIEALANGEYRYSTLSFEYAEFKNIARQFNQMSARIESRERELLAVNQALETEIRERKKAENSLRDSEAQYKSLYNNIPVGAFRIRPGGEIIDYNAFLLNLLRIPPDRDVRSSDGGNFYRYPEDRENMIRGIIETGQVSGFECQLKNADNEFIWATISARGIKDDRGKLNYIDGIIEDITEKKAYENQLKRFAKIIEQADEEVVITDIDGVIQYVNPSFEKNTGYTAKEVLGKKPSILKSGLHPDQFYQNMWKTILAKNSWKGVFKNRCKNGEIMMHDTTISPIVDASEKISAFVSIRRDITRQTRLNHQLQQSQKMQAIGTLAGGIAHDFNNILSGIFGYGQLAMSKVDNPEKVNDCLSKLLKAAQRATELVQQILTFSRQTEYMKKPFSVYLEVNEALKLLRSSIPATIAIKQQLDSRSKVLADPIRLHQVIMNLCTNAYHAMRDTGGILTVSLADKTIATPQKLKNRMIPPGKYLVMEISDTGHGMDEKTLERAFEPYFTTKKRGEGTGLGLAIVQAVVDEHNGFLEVSSAPLKGTCFHLYFPVIEKQVPPPEESKESLVPVTGNETVMIVDDEDDIRKVYEEILSINGYQTVVFSEGESAANAFESDPKGFDIIITDVTMPLKTGVQLIESVRALDKKVPIIVCSGFSELMNARKAARMGANLYLTKPVFPNKLLKKVRELLDGKNTPSKASQTKA